jgi:hypothetical protein
MGRPSEGMDRMTAIVTGLSFKAIPGSPALKLIPPPRRLIVLAAESVRVYLRRRPHRGVPQALRHHRQRYPIR